MNVLDFKKLILSSYDDAKCKDLHIVKKLLECDEVKKYAIGKNEQSIELIGKYKIDGVIDDTSNKISKMWQGVPVVHMKDVHKKHLIINCVSSICPILVTKKLMDAGLNNIISISDLISHGRAFINPPWFVTQQREEIFSQLEYWSKLYLSLVDDDSRKTLIDVIRYRLTADQTFMRNYSVRLKDQYFEDFMGYNKEIFVDAGGFDGDTTEEFIKRYPDYQKVIFFEPSKKNMCAAKQRLFGARDIDFHQLGVSNSEGTLSFNANAGKASAVSEHSTEIITAIALDNILKDEPVTFIKMDLEGWETKALQGATQIIKKNRPKLAIAVYHSAKDFREIPELLLNIHADYKIYLRHYTQGWSETVMFFL
jgi:FkbM family methyltransferase